MFLLSKPSLEIQQPQNSVKYFSQDNLDRVQNLYLQNSPDNETDFMAPEIIIMLGHNFIYIFLPSVNEGKFPENHYCSLSLPLCPSLFLLNADKA